MPRLRLALSTLFLTALLWSAPARAGELEDIRALLDQMQQTLQQQQARIEQLEKQAATRNAPENIAPSAASTPSPAARPNATPRIVLASSAGSSPNSIPPSTQPNATEPSQPDMPFATFYGRLDLFGEANWGGSTGNRLAIESGGMTGSRVGLKGGKALSPETNFIYQLETGFFANDGKLGQTDSTHTRIFGRQLYVGLEGRLGKLTVGRQYSPFFLEMMVYDAFDNGYGSPTNDGNVKPGPTRYDNSIVYSSPRYHGLASSTFASLGGENGGVEQSTLGLTLDYAKGPLGLGLAYQYDNHNTYTDRSSRHAFAGASYQIGSVRLMGGLAGVDTRYDSGADSEWRSWFFGSRIDVTATGQLRLNYGEGHTPGATIKDRGRVFSAAWMESINQQFKAYLVWSRHLNEEGVAFAPSGTAANGYYTVNPGDTANGLAAGVQYYF